jgi:hypothetical protein
MALPKLGKPPQGPWIDPETGNLTRHAYNWLDLLRRYLPPDETGVLPVELGGTGVGTLAELASSQAASSSSGSGTYLSQTKSGVVLNRPATGADLDFADTVVTWDSAFSTATYTVTASFDPNVVNRGDLSIHSQTTTTVTLRLSNFGDSTFASRATGTAIVTGVHS